MKLPARLFLVIVALVALSKHVQAQAKDSIPLEKDYFLTPGWDFSTLLLLEGQKLSVLTGNGATVAKTFQLEKKYKRTFQRGDTFVGLLSAKAIEILDKNLKVTKHIDVQHQVAPTFNVHELTIHPTKKISYMSILAELTPPGYRVLVIDETTGEVSAPNEMYGTFMGITPDGKTLFVGLKDLCPKGFKFPIRGGKFVIQSDRGSIDTLFSYALEGEKGTPRLKQIIDKSGGNGQGIAVSPDGKRVTYLSYVGFPAFSGNLVAYDTASLTKIQPITYKLKDLAPTTCLAFHPMLPMAAVPGSQLPVVILHRETGEVEKDRLKGDPDFSDLKTAQIFFSPDAKSVVVAGQAKSGEFSLRTAELNLTAAELATIAKGYTRPNTK